MSSRWQSVDGVLAVDKPPGPSSTTVLQHVRRLYAARKAGHGGTLDPAASGLLVVLFGEASKFSQWQLGGDKTYTGTIRLGVTTTTDDAEGEVLESRTVCLDGTDLGALARRFTGLLRQRPPAFSALKRDGRPLYAYARAGQAVAVEEREVRISRLILVQREPACLGFEVDCGGGTYIRSLARDLGAVLGCGAHLESLRRTGAGGLDVASAARLEDLEAADTAWRLKRLLPPDALLSGIPRLDLSPSACDALSVGRRIPVPYGCGPGISRAYDLEGRFLGVVEAGPEGVLAPRRMMSGHDSGG